MGLHTSEPSKFGVLPINPPQRANRLHIVTKSSAFICVCRELSCFSRTLGSRHFMLNFEKKFERAYRWSCRINIRVYAVVKCGNVLPFLLPLFSHFFLLPFPCLSFSSSPLKSLKLIGTVQKRVFTKNTMNVVSISQIYTFRTTPVTTTFTRLVQ